MRIGGLFEGYGGLTMGVRSVLGGDLAWYSEIDPAASRVLAHHHPDVPNLGDITAVDWSAVEPVDVLTGGFPCQDVSAAGKRAGMAPGTRSGLWTHMAYAISQLRPALVVVENVRGLLSAEAHCDVERCPWCLGDERDVVLRALGAVLADLAELGYDAVWYGLRASDVGAPHQRFRVFVVAQDADSAAWDQRRIAAPGQAEGGRARADAGGPGRALAADSNGQHEGTVAAGTGRRKPEASARNRCGSAANAAGDGRHEGWSEPAGLVGRPDVAFGGAPTADADRQREHQPAGGISDLWAGPSVGRGGPALEWGDFAPAIHRWEHILGRSAPVPTVAGQRAQRVLNPAFVEFMMGLPAGHVTAVEGLSRNDQLKILGNGVVPQQAAAAVRLLLPLLSTAERAA